jgi:hypothetical protein
VVQLFIMLGAVVVQPMLVELLVLEAEHQPRKIRAVVGMALLVLEMVLTEQQTQEEVAVRLVIMLLLAALEATAAPASSSSK